MLTLQAVQYAVPGTQPVRAPVAEETVAAVPSAAESDHSQNDGPRDRGAEAERMAREARTRAADPATLVGPPPAFQANVLEAERARVREGERLGEAEARRGAEPARPEAAVAPADAAPRDGAAEADANRSGEAADLRREANAERNRMREDRAEAREAPGPTGLAYGGVKEYVPGMLDVSR